MAFEIRPNSASAFKPREAGPAEFVGNGDIDGEKYVVSIETANRATGKAGPYIARKIKFTGGDNGIIFDGMVFDKRLDSATGQEKQLNEKAPTWTGTVKAQINHELVITKDVSIWERVGEKSGLYFSISIKDKVARGVQPQMESAGADPF